MVRLKCPQCSNVIDAPPGTSPTCPACGFTGAATAAGAPSAQPVAPHPAPASSPFSAPTEPAQGTQPRPGWATFAAVVHFVSGALAAIVGFAFLAVGPFVAEAIFEDEEVADLGGAVFAAIGVGVIVVAVLIILLGTQLLKGREWARIVALVFGFLGALSGLGTLVSGDPSAVLGLALNVLVIVALMLPVTKAWFAQEEASRKAGARPAWRA